LWAGQRSVLTLLQARVKHWKEGVNEYMQEDWEFTNDKLKRMRR